MHLAMCRHCRRYMRQMEIIREAVRSRSAQAVDASKLEDFKKKLIDRLRR